MLCNSLLHIFSPEDAYHVESHINAGGNPGGGDELVLVDVPPMLDRNIGIAPQLLKRRPMGCGAFTVLRYLLES